MAIYPLAKGWLWTFAAVLAWVWGLFATWWSRFGLRVDIVDGWLEARRTIPRLGKQTVIRVRASSITAVRVFPRSRGSLHRLELELDDGRIEVLHTGMYDHVAQTFASHIEIGLGLVDAPRVRVEELEGDHEHELEHLESDAEMTREK